MKALYVICGIVTAAGALASVYSLISEKDAKNIVVKLIAFGTQTYMAIYCAVKAAML